MTPYVTTVEGTVIYITIIVSYSLVASGENMAKLTNAQLTNRVTQLEKEIERLLARIAELEANSSGPKSRKDVSTVTDIKVTKEKIPGAMAWVVRYLGLEGTWDEKFFTNFSLYTNEARTRLVIIPNAWNAQAKNFIEAAMAAKYRKGIKGNYYGTGRGFWLEVPVKK